MLNRVKNIYHLIRRKKLGGKKFWKYLYRMMIFNSLLSKNRGIYVIDEEWDNLIILDACRYDIFEELNTILGRLEFRISKGSCTRDFLFENFNRYPDHSKLKEIVYVTANPYVDKFLFGRFCKIYPTWDYGWDDKLNTVPPKNVLKDTLRAHQDYPGKRLIIHFVQPHSPFLDPQFPIKTTRDSFRETMLGKEVAEASSDAADDIAVIQPWDLIELGKLDKKTVWEGYKNNLKAVLPYVKKIVDTLPGKTIITSDHGELAGEKVHHILYPFKEYGHPCGLLSAKELVKVPWLIIEKDKTQ